MSFLTRWDDDHSRPKFTSALRDVLVRAVLPAVTKSGTHREPRSRRPKTQRHPPQCKEVAKTGEICRRLGRPFSGRICSNSGVRAQWRRAWTDLRTRECIMW
mgnify:CR=1 FL=1